MPIDLGPTSLLSTPAPILKKPPYLITLLKLGKVNTVERFISLDKPEPHDGFIQVKGIFCDKDEDEIVKGFVAFVGATPKEAIVEMMFPQHRIVSIRSLVFNAVKSISKVKEEVP